MSRVDDHASDAIDSEMEQRLLASATDALINAYAPYSQFRVGSCVLTEAGRVYSGANVENQSYGLTICAERAAICTAVAAEGPRMSLVAIAVVTDPRQACSPCGACRQVIAEFGRGSLVIYHGPDGWIRTPIADLLPDTFGLSLPGAAVQ